MFSKGKAIVIIGITYLIQYVYKFDKNMLYHWCSIFLYGRKYNILRYTGFLKQKGSAKGWARNESW